MFAKSKSGEYGVRAATSKCQEDQTEKEKPVLQDGRSDFHGCFELRGPPSTEDHCGSRKSDKSCVGDQSGGTCAEYCTLDNDR